MSAVAAPSAAQTDLAERKQPTRRSAELGLIAVIWAICSLAIIAASLGVAGEILPSVWRLVISTGVPLLVLHLVVRRFAPYADPLLVPTAAALNLLGIAMIYRLDIADILRADASARSTPPPIATNQVTWLALGTIAAAFVIIIVRDHRNLRRFTYISGLIGLVLLLLPLVPGLGLTIRGANLWIAVGPFTFQPAELAKVVLVVFFASYLVLKRDSLALIRRKILGIGFPRGRDLGPILVAWLIALLIVISQRDLGTAMMFFGLFVALLYVSTGRRSWIVLGTLLTILGAVGSYFAFSHVRIRFLVWANPFEYEREGYQIVQAMFGFANGGVLGTGWGRGYPQQVPFAESDFIFAAIGEEIGLVGAFAVIVLFAILVERCLRLARASRDPFGTLLATGFAVVFGLQTFVVLGGVTKLIPHTGLTTPFMSAGGSSLIANWIIIGLLLRISDQVRRPDPVIVPPDDETTELVKPA